MELGIAGRRAIVLGAGGGLGGAIASALADEGVAIAAVDLAGDRAGATAERITAAGGTAFAYEWDIGDLAAADGLVERVHTELGSVEILINITGGPPPSPAFGIPPEEWRSQFESMVLGLIYLTDLVLGDMRAAHWGRIITSASSGVVVPIPDLAISNSLRMSLLGWSKGLACATGRDGITVNVVLPGRIATGRIRDLDARRAGREGRPLAEVEGASTATIPLGRYGDPAEYGKVVAFLASDAASYVTGSVVRVDGGLIASI